MQAKSLKFLELPQNLIQQVLSHLTFREMESVKNVSVLFLELSENLLKNALRKCLKLISLKIKSLQDSLNYGEISLGEKVILNQILTRLEMVKFSVNSVFILSRHSLKSLDFLLLGQILDEIFDKLRDINTTDTFCYLGEDPTIQNILKDFTILTSNFKINSIYPFGVYIMDILDLLLGINFSKTSIYKLKESSCSINSCYYTNNHKFLLYLPDFTFMKDCQNRKLNDKEQQGILKYLLVIVNLYNGLFCKNEEYRREMEIRKFGRFKDDLSHIETESVFDPDLEIVVESKEKFLNSNERNKKGLLLCEMFLDCQLNEAPFEIIKSFESLRKETDFDSTKSDFEEFSTNSYGVRIRLKITIQHKNTEEYEINILDGNELDKPK